MRTNYVCGFARMPEHGSNPVILLLQKQFGPPCVLGKLNGIGGKVESGESDVDAMHREWREETGLNFNLKWRAFATIAFQEMLVTFFSASIHESLSRRSVEMLTVNDVGEAFVLLPLNRALSIEKSRFQDYEVVPNLLWLLPAAFSDPNLPVIAAVASREE